MDTFIPTFQAFRDALNAVEKKRITVEASRILERIDQFLHDIDETKPSFAEIQSILIDRDRLESLCLYGIRETRAIQIQIEDIDKDLSDWLEGWEPTGVDNRAIEERLWKAQIESPEHYWGANAIRNRS
jgi:hypothetical protein